MMVSMTTNRVTAMALLAGLAVGMAGSLHAGERRKASDFLNWPKVMDELVGDPVVRVKDGGAAGGQPSVRPKRGAGNDGRKLRLLEISDLGDRDVAPVVARAVAEVVWEDFVEPCPETGGIAHLIPMDKSRFLRVSQGQLLGEPVNDEGGNAWWRVRMGLPLTPDREHHLIVMRAKSDAEFYSHFSLGVRRVGGKGVDAGDVVLDPRAPWLSDTHPEIVDWFNLDNSLLMRLEVVPLSDWMHTQTTYRGMGIIMEFMPATKEVVTLIREGAESAKRNEVTLGQFRPLRNNCASHGETLFQALMPLDEDLCGKHPIADLPKRLARKATKHFGHIRTVYLPAQPPPPGTIQSQNSTVRTPPDRCETPEVKRLMEIPELN